MKNNRTKKRDLALELDMARAHAAALEQRNAELAEEVNLAKSAFLANISHELRTPLNSILILSRMLADRENEISRAKIVQYSGAIHRSGSALLELINDLIDLTKSATGKLNLKFEDVCWQPLLEDVELRFNPQTDERGLEFVVRIDDDVPREIHTDHRRLVQIVDNLLSNAVKFTERGQIELHVFRPGPEHECGGSQLALPELVGLSVADSGIGIAAELRHHIFDDFYQVDSTHSRKFSGPGLGLSLSRKLAHRLGGDLTVESTVGAGSTFTLVLPQDSSRIRPDDQEERPLSAATARDETLPAPRQGVEPVGRPDDPGPGAEAPGDAAPDVPDKEQILAIQDTLRHKRILIVENDMRVAFSLLAAFQATGAELVVSATSQDGLEQLHREADFDLVLLDMCLTDGLAMLSTIRTLPGGADLAIVSLLVAESETDRPTVLAAGADAVITRPFAVQELVTTLERLLT